MGKVARVTSKGQVTIPVEMRKKMGIAEGTDLMFYEGLDGSLHVRLHRPRKGAGRASFSWPEAPGTDDEVKEAIATTIDEREEARRRGRGRKGR